MAKSVIFFLLFLVPTVGLAQDKFYKLAEKAFANEKYYSAIEYYKKEYSGDHDKRGRPEILFKVGFCYIKISDYKQAEAYFSKCIKAKYPDPISHYYLAVCKKYLLKYDDAMTEYQNYLKDVPDAPKTFITSCETAKELMNNSTNYVLENMAMINSKDDDMLPAFGKNDSSLFFISNRNTANNPVLNMYTGKLDREICLTVLDSNGKWSDPYPKQGFIYVTADETSVFYDSLRSVFYFSGITEKKEKKRTIRKEKLFFSSSGTKDNAEMFSFCNTDTGSFNFTTPFVIDMNEIIFSSDMPGGFGGYDLWSIHWNNKAKWWDKPVNLGSMVNSSSNEKAPYLNSVDQILYFSSDREEGMGGYDNYVSKFQGNTWGLPENLKYPINSSADDLGIVFDGDKDEGYISSNRDGGKGGYDIFKFYRKK